MSRFQRHITWTDLGKEIRLEVPYNLTFNSKQRELSLGGIWNKTLKSWIFSAQHSEKLKDLLFYAYGDDAHNRYDQCDLRVDVVRSNALIGDATRASIQFLGYPIAKASGNHSKVNLLHGLSVTSGGFTSGGSINNWRTCVSRNTSFVIKSVSYPYYMEIIERYRQEIHEGVVSIHLLERYLNRPGYEMKTFEDPIKESLVSKNDKTVTTDFAINEETIAELRVKRDQLLNQLLDIYAKIKKLEENDH